jgi:hypothetical protein
VKKIKLTKGKFALVDNEDFEYLNQWKWHLSEGGYAKRSQHIRLGINKYKSKIIRMHRLINNTPEGMFTDHINRNKLDNRRSNLRTVNKSQNAFNSDVRTNNKSGYKGVHFDTWSNQWRAEIKINYHKITLGRYSRMKDAIIARKTAEQKYGI